MKVVNLLQDINLLLNNIKEYTDLNFIKEEIKKSKDLFKKYNWPVLDVTRKSVEESAASILKIYEIQKNK